MKNIFYYIASVIFTISAGCNKLSENLKVIENQTTNSFKVRIYTLPFTGYISDSFILNPNSIITIEKIVSKDGPRYYSRENCVYSNRDSINITIVGNNLAIIKNLNNSDNWLFSKSGLDAECRAIITDADIVPK